MTTPAEEREWWDQHVDRVHVWGTDDVHEWTVGIGHCLELLLTTLKPIPNRVLDLGCGLGRLAVPFASMTYPISEVVGIDSSVGMLREATKLAKERRVTNVEFVVNDGRTIPESVGMFDAVFSVLVFQHLPPDAVAGYLSEIRRVLNPDGRFVVQHVYREHDPGFLSYSYPIEVMNDLARGAGLTVDELFLDRVHPGWAWSTWTA